MRHLLKPAIIVPVAIFVCCSGLTLLAVRELQHVDRGEHVDSVSWLPENAFDICYYRNYSFTAYEFNIDEEGFRKWTDEPVQEITKPVRITRYSEPTFQRDDTQPLIEAPEDYPYRVIRNGLYYAHLQDNGGGVWVAYDRDLGRAYYRTQPR